MATYVPSLIHIRDSYKAQDRQWQHSEETVSRVSFLHVAIFKPHLQSFYNCNIFFLSYGAFKWAQS